MRSLVEECWGRRSRCVGDLTVVIKRVDAVQWVAATTKHFMYDLLDSLCTREQYCKWRGLGELIAIGR